MNRLDFKRRYRFVFCVSATIIAMLTTNTVRSAELPRNDAIDTAAAMIAASQRAGGICVLAGQEDVDLAIAIGKQGQFVVQSLHGTQADIDRHRESIRSAGMYGDVSAEVSRGTQLPYGDNLINLLVLDDLAIQNLELNEVARVLAPLGIVLVRASTNALDRIAAQLDELGVESSGTVGAEWVAYRKRWPNAIDQWTHFLHGADGNPVAEDHVVGPPRHYQWIGGPMWLRSHETDSSISTLVTAQGRLFYIIDEAPISVAGNHSLPDKWFLVAQDAFNGVPLWKIPIRRWGWREWKETWFTNRPGDFPLNIRKRLVAVGDHVYVTLGYHAPVSQLDANTGEILQTYADTERTHEILHVNSTLILSTLEEEGVRVRAVDAASGQTQWVSKTAYRGTKVDYLKWSGSAGGVKPADLDPALNLATDGKTVTLIDGPDLVALDFTSGDQLWQASFPLDEADNSAGGIRTNGDLWNGTMIVKEGVVLHASPYCLAAFAATDGKQLWSQPKRYIGHLWYEWKDVFVIDGLVWTWSEEFDEAILDTGGGKKQRSLWPVSVKGYDLHSGRLAKEVPLGPVFRTHHHHRCYRNRATPRYILASRRGTEFVDLIHGQHTVHNWVRGTCHVGMFPANGLQYAPPHPCQCYLEEKLTGMNALAPARAVELATTPIENRLQRGTAFGDVGWSDSNSSSDDWPTFRADAARTGAISTSVPDTAKLAWDVPLGRKLSAPTAANGMVFASLIDEHQVVSLDRRNGEQLWHFFTGARVDSPPTFYQGTVLFGSADGMVYCLRADDGAMVWRFQAAPASRHIGAFGQLESAWPVHGSVLVQDATVYFAAGRSSQLDGGIYLYGLDAASGALRCQRRLEGPDYKLGDFEENYHLPMGVLPDVLVGDGEKIFMRSAAFDASLNPVRAQSELQPKGGLLEDSYFKRTPWTMDGEYARLISRDKQSVYYVRMFDSLRGLDPTVYFTPGRNGYLLFSKNSAERRSGWTQRIPIRVRAMVAAGDRLYVAGPPDVVDPKDPLGSFEGRKGGLLFCVNAQTGERLAEYELPSPPVFNGAAVAEKQLLITTENGRMLCFGEGSR